MNNYLDLVIKLNLFFVLDLPYYAWILTYLQVKLIKVFGTIKIIISFFSEWDVVTMEISNGSNDIQSKVVYYRPREKI